MTATVSLTEANVFKVLGDFLTSILPASCEAFQGQVNRVSEPPDSDYAVMWAINRTRLATNETALADVAFTGSIAALELTVTQMLEGTISEGLTVSGDGVASGTVIGAQTSGTPGGSGTYDVTPSQTVASTTMQAGLRGSLQRIQVAIQIDVHGPSSAENAQIISTLLRDAVATEFFDASGFDIQSLYVDDPKQIPFANDQQQLEKRWVITAQLQANPIVSMHQQFAGALEAGLVNVEREYPQ